MTGGMNPSSSIKRWIEENAKKQGRRGTLPEARHEEHVTLNIETRDERDRGIPSKSKEINILAPIGERKMLNGG